MNSDYYKAYDKRYRKTYEDGYLWEIPKPTSEVINIINKYKINKSDKILDLGCGEGRDALYLLDNGYNVLAVDYSINVISKCNELSNNKYIDKFKQFDIFEDEINTKFDFIYSIAVIHMFIDENHRRKFYKFIYEHLNKDGKALIIAMGDGVKEYSTHTQDAFKETERINMNSNKKVLVASTSLRIKSLENMCKEITLSNFSIIDSYIIDCSPNFSLCEVFIVERG